MKLFIGLGNPGNKYHKNRHNAGFLCLDYIQQHALFDNWKDSSFSAIISEGRIHNEKILLCKPTTFMNLSGDAVQKILHFYKLSPKDILVFSDDIDMDFEKIRFRNTGSHGGQNGLRDIITKIGTQDFPRIKIGVGRHPCMSVANWVLSNFSQTEQQQLHEKVFPQVLQKVEEFLNSQ